MDLVFIWACSTMRVASHAMPVRRSDGACDCNWCKLFGSYENRYAESEKQEIAKKCQIEKEIEQKHLDILDGKYVQILNLRFQLINCVLSAFVQIMISSNLKFSFFTLLNNIISFMNAEGCGSICKSGKWKKRKFALFRWYLFAFRKFSCHSYKYDQKTCNQKN